MIEFKPNPIQLELVSYYNINFLNNFSIFDLVNYQVITVYNTLMDINHLDATLSPTIINWK
jgi:hypothetical protein